MIVHDVQRFLHAPMPYAEVPKRSFIIIKTRRNPNAIPSAVHEKLNREPASACKASISEA